MKVTQTPLLMLYAGAMLCVAAMTPAGTTYNPLETCNLDKSAYRLVTDFAKLPLEVQDQLRRNMNIASDPRDFQRGDVVEQGKQQRLFQSAVLHNDDLVVLYERVAFGIDTNTVLFKRSSPALPYTLQGNSMLTGNRCAAIQAVLNGARSGNP